MFENFLDKYFQVNKGRLYGEEEGESNVQKHAIQDAWNIDREMQMMLDVVSRSWRAFYAIMKTCILFCRLSGTLRDLQRGNDIIRFAFW